LHGGTFEIVTENLGGLHALSPVRAALPGAHGGTTGGGRRNILEIEVGGLSEEEGGYVRARRGIDKLGFGDDVEGYFHFKAIPGGVDEPGETVPQLADVGNEVVFTDLGSYPTPSSNGEICTRNDRNGLALVNETKYVCIVTRKEVGGRRRWRGICSSLSLSIEQFCLCASILKPNLGLSLLHA
jgi:hypothetical protein